MRLYSLVWLLAALALTATAVLAQQANGKVTDLVWPAPKDLIFKSMILPARVVRSRAK